MNVDDTTFRLSFSKPATDLILAGASMVELAFEKDSVSIRPTNARSPRTGRIVIGERGGAIAAFGNKMSLGMYEAIQRLAIEQVRKPYFLLQREGNDWYQFVPHRGSPLRHLASCRLWPGDSVDSRLPDPEDEDEDTPPWFDEIRQAIRMDREAKEKLGRPSRELVEARETVRLFRKLMREVGPDVDRVNELLAEVQRELNK